MSDEIKSFLNVICVRKLPQDVERDHIYQLLQSFGPIQNVYLKRRVARDSQIFLANPFAIVVFDDVQTVNYVMNSRPLYLGEDEVFVRRFLPRLLRNSFDPYRVSRKALIHVPSYESSEILPGNSAIVAYLEQIGGKIEYFDRLDNKAVLVQYDDYDPVDLCCLMAPHLIDGQLVIIEKCLDEKETRRQVEQRQKPNSPSDIPRVVDQSVKEISPIPVLSVQDQLNQLQFEYHEVTSRLEREHEKRVAALNDELEEIAKERIRLQRLTVDCEHERDRLLEANRQVQKAYSESLREKPLVQSEGDRQLQEILRKNVELNKKLLQ